MGIGKGASGPSAVQGPGGGPVGLGGCVVHAGRGGAAVLSAADEDLPRSRMTWEWSFRGRDE